MDTMNERRDRIAGFVNENGSVSFRQLKELLPNVSEMTLRTDLKALDEERRIVRIHGGAKSVDVVIGTDDLLGNRTIRNQSAKRQIAEKALQLIKPHTTIYIDSGSTTTQLARIFPDQPQIIYTSGLSCANELAKLEQPHVYLPAGRLNRYSMSVCGAEGARELERVNFDIAFMGVTAFSLESGFTCGVENEAYLKRSAMRHAGMRVMLFDLSKIGKHSTFTFAQLEDADILITEGDLPDSVAEMCRKYDVEVL
ncbi:MAG: DeoR/GlpR transcriptional regulator [Lachnospiraceae bacterium]|nr:DeoR/GlpR transcriptional regulator [Lachnospiraceae bacterium]